MSNNTRHYTNETTSLNLFNRLTFVNILFLSSFYIQFGEKMRENWVKNRSFSIFCTTEHLYFSPTNLVVKLYQFREKRKKNCYNWLTACHFSRYFFFPLQCLHKPEHKSSEAKNGKNTWRSFEILSGHMGFFPFFFLFFFLPFPKNKGNRIKRHVVGVIYLVVGIRLIYYDEEKNSQQVKIR